jgi:demethylmenaquinone methyltransferase/2-methoxy-6-polyprenyl-1,4-benzoquinol methylase
MVRQPLPTVVCGYDRIARFYSGLAPIFLIRPKFRRKAVTRLQLKPGDVVLEVGCGTGLNLPLLVDAVGSSGVVIGIDASSGMLERARALVAQNGWQNVRLLEQDASQLDIDRELDAVLFSLSYSVLPDPQPALARSWERLRGGGRLVVFDGTLPANTLGRALRPFASLLIKITPGNADTHPWDDLAALSSPVETEKFQPGIYYTCAITKQ